MMNVAPKPTVKGVTKMPAFLTILSMILALLQVGKEVAPVVVPLVKPAQKEQLQYRYNDGQHAYYSDSTGRNWGRVDRSGMIQYAQNPNLIR